MGKLDLNSVFRCCLKDIEEELVTFAKEVMFLPGFVCLCVCEQDNSKTYGQILMKFSKYI